MKDSMVSSTVPKTDTKSSHHTSRKYMKQEQQKPIEIPKVKVANII